MNTTLITPVSRTVSNCGVETINHYYQVGEIFIKTERKAWGFSVSTGPSGNARCLRADSPLEAAKIVREAYPTYLAACKYLNAPMTSAKNL